MPSVAGFVLAGGRSSRMGRDKALLSFAGRPLVQHALDLLSKVLLSDCGLERSIVGDRPDLAAYAPVIPDEETGRGPLQGICRAMAASSAELSVFISVDTPLLPASLLSCLLYH